MERTQPVAVLDSGVGGVSVLRELRRLMPAEDYLYFGDSAHAPYGERTAGEVRELTLAHAQTLFDEGAKALVVACNTATGAAIGALRQRFVGRPIIGVEPALKPAALCGDHPTVLVMATPLTLRQEKFEHLLAQYNARARVITLPCHGLVELIERGVTGGEALRELLRRLFAPLAGEEVDAVVLGCTHYPLVHAAIAQAARETLRGALMFFDGGAGTARQTRRQLAAAGLCRPAGFSDEPGRVIWRNSSSDPRLPALCQTLLDAP